MWTKKLKKKRLKVKKCTKKCASDNTYEISQNL